MGQKFCTSCGATLLGDANFCENCGASVEHDVPVSPDVPEAIPVSPPGEPLAAPVPSVGAAPKVPVTIIAGILIVIVIAAAAIFVALPKLAGTTGAITGPATTTQTTVVPVTTTPQTVATTVANMPTQNPFPDALALKQKFPFGSGDLASEATIYRYWINDTYQWHNDKDNRYYVEKPMAGYKFLAIFVDVVNNGNTRVWPPQAENVHLIYDGKEYGLDQDHYLPDKSVNIQDTPIEIKEIQYLSKMAGSEYVEDYGYSHGSQLSYLYPGVSNAIDGYLIYEVPKSLTPDKTFVKIEFNGKDVGVWKLA